MIDLLKKYRMIDLTHPLNSNAPSWSGDCGFRHKVIVDYPEACRVHWMELNAGAGTHMDAPLHFIPGAKSVADIPIEELIAEVCLIDVSTKAHADYYISAADITEFEKTHGKIKADSFVIGYTGWDRFWHDRNQFRNPDAGGQMHFPGFSKESAELLLERKIKGLGIDSLSPDCLDLSFPVHHLFLGAGKYLVENLANCSKLPPIGASILILPIKIEEGTEAPVRALAFCMHSPLGKINNT